MTARLAAVNVGLPADHEWLGRTVTTAIFKAPVSGRVAVRCYQVDGDRQAAPKFHGGRDKAVYAYAAEDVAWWESELGRSLGAAAFGENLTVTGMDVSGAVIGERWRLGSTLLQVTAPRLPCFKLGLRSGDRHLPRRFAGAGRPGAYLTVVQEGEIGAGDAIEVLDRSAHGVTVSDVARAYHVDRDLAPRLLQAPELPRSWRAWAAERGGM
jgi:MOSC domain-containing protein YiiM